MVATCWSALQNWYIIGGSPENIILPQVSQASSRSRLFIETPCPRCTLSTLPPPL